MRRELAAAALCLAALGACAQGDSATTSARTTTPSAASATSTPTSTPSETAAGEQAALAVVDLWLSTLSDGDAGAAYDMLGPFSRQAVGTMDGMEGLMPGLQEGMAAFAGATDRTSLEVPGQPGAHVVTYSGDVQREGQTEFAAVAVIVHPAGELDVLDAFAIIGPSVDSPPPGSTDLDPAGDVRVYLPAGGTVTALLDGELLTSVAEEGADGDQVLVTVSPPAGTWPGGRHVVTVAVTPTTPDGDGPWSAEAAPVTIG